MVATEALIRRPLGTADLPDLEALVAEAGWNQTARDWRRMLALGVTCGCADPSGRIVASAVTMAYGGVVGWIGMVLVAGDWRRRGIATDLLSDCVADLRAGGLVPGLDATPLGEEVYRNVGFEGDQTITRWRRPARRRGATGPEVDVLPRGDTDWIAGLDAEAFGASRRDLVGDFVVGATGWKIGREAFLLQRPGRMSRQLGPLCARCAGDAERLVSAAVSECGEPLLIDVPDRHAGLRRVLEAAGFTAERPFRRMYLGARGRIGDPDLLYALAGPELG